MTTAAASVQGSALPEAPAPFCGCCRPPHPHATIRLSVPPPDSGDKKPPRRSEVLHVAEAAARGTCPGGSGPLRSHIASSALCGAHTSFLPLAGAEAGEGLEEQQTWGPRAPRCPPRPHGWPGHVVLTQSHPGPSSGLRGEASPTHADGVLGDTRGEGGRVTRDDGDGLGRCSHQPRTPQRPEARQALPAARAQLVRRREGRCGAHSAPSTGAQQKGRGGAGAGQEGTGKEGPGPPLSSFMNEAIRPEGLRGRPQGHTEGHRSVNDRVAQWCVFPPASLPPAPRPPRPHPQLLCSLPSPQSHSRPILPPRGQLQPGDLHLCPGRGRGAAAHGVRGAGTAGQRCL